MSPRKRKLFTPASESDVPSKQQQQASSSSVEPLAFPNGNAKYNRIHYACSECYRRKQKCNRQRPCQHCLTRNIAHKCKDYIPSNSNPDSDTESVSRLSRLERLLEDYLPRILHRVESASLHASSNALHSTTAPRDRLAWPTSQLALPRNNPTQSTTATASTLAANGTTVDQLETQGRLSPETGLYNGGPTSHITSLLGGLPGSPPRIQAAHLPIRTTRPTSDFDDAMIKHGRPSPPSYELLHALISRDHCIILLQHYFDNIDWMHQPFPHRRTRKSLDDFLQSEPTITIQNINIFAVLCGVCAVAALSVHHVLFPDQQAQRSQIARRYHYAARRALLMSSFMGREDLDLIFAWVLSCHFLTVDRHYGEAFASGASAIRAAFCIGLHRDGTKLGLSEEEVEVRRRSWAAIFCIDRSMAAATGRPALIDELFCDTQDLDDQATWHLPLESLPLAQTSHTSPSPTTYTLTFYRYGLARLEGQVAVLSQRLDGPVSIESVLALDSKIVEYQNALPWYFKAELVKDGIRCDKSLDTVHSFLLTHRYLINSNIDGLRIALHRPYMIRTNDAASGARLAECRKRCLEAALHQAEILRDSVRDLRSSIQCPASRLVWRVQVGTHSWFEGLLICGLGLLMNPRASNAARLKSHLEYYLHEYHERGFIADDEMCGKEAKVLALFLSRLEEQLSDNAVPPFARQNDQASTTAMRATSGDPAAPPQARRPQYDSNLLAPALTSSLDTASDSSPRGVYAADSAYAAAQADKTQPRVDPQMLGAGPTPFSLQRGLSSDSRQNLSSYDRSAPILGSHSSATDARSSCTDGTDRNATTYRTYESGKAQGWAHEMVDLFAEPLDEVSAGPGTSQMCTTAAHAPSTFAPLATSGVSMAFGSLSDASAAITATTAGLHNPNFDPAYWQDLIDKILS